MTLRIDTSEFFSSSLVIGNTGLGVLGTSVSNTGFAYPRLSFPADNSEEIRVSITSTSVPAGALFVNENGSYSIAGGTPAGNYTVDYSIYKTGVLFGSFSDPIPFGSEALTNVTTETPATSIFATGTATSLVITSEDAVLSSSATGQTKHLVIDTTDLLPSSLTIGNTGHGVLGKDIPSTGTHGAPYLYNDLSLPGDLGKEYRGTISSNTFPPETFFAYEDSSFTVIGADAGVYSFTYQLYENGIAVGSPVTSNVTVASGTVQFIQEVQPTVISGSGTGQIKHLVIDTTDLISGSLTLGSTGFGVLGKDIPSTGTHGVPYIYNDLSLPNDLGKEYRGYITSSTFPADTFFAYENSSFTVIGADPGIYNFSYQLYEAFTPLGSPVSVTVVVGDKTGQFLVTTDDGTSALFAQSSSTGAFVGVSENTSISGSAFSNPTSAFNTQTDSSVIAGSATATPTSFFNIFTEDGTSSWIGATAEDILCSVNIVTDSAVMAGTGAQTPPVTGSFTLTTDLSVISGVGQQTPDVIGTLSVITENSIISGSAEQTPPVPATLSVITEDSFIGGSAAQATAVIGSFNIFTEDSAPVFNAELVLPDTSVNIVSENSLVSGIGVSIFPVGQFSIETESAVISGSAERDQISGVFNVTTDNTVISGIATPVSDVIVSFNTTTDAAVLSGSGGASVPTIGSFNLFTEDVSSTFSGFSASGDTAFNVSTEPALVSGSGSSDVNTSINSTTESPIFTGTAGFISEGILSVITDDAVPIFTAGENTGVSSGEFNISTENTVSGFIASGNAGALPPKGGIAVHLGGGVCITSNGQLFVVIM